MKNSSIYTLETEKGWAVYAGQSFKTGTVILEFTGPLYTRREYIQLLDPGNNHFLQVDEDSFMGPSGKEDDLVNHSCNPNCGLLYGGKGIFLQAIRNIPMHEELAFDYSTTMDEDHWEMECLCGDPLCRSLIRDFKHLPLPLKKKYIRLGIVPSFIAARFVNL